MSRLTNYPFHLPREHALKLLIHLSEISPVGCGRFEFDARLAIVERSPLIADDAVSTRHPGFDLGDSEIECGVGCAPPGGSADKRDRGRSRISSSSFQEIRMVMYKQRMDMIIQPLS